MVTTIDHNAAERKENQIINKAKLLHNLPFKLSISRVQPTEFRIERITEESQVYEYYQRNFLFIKDVRKNVSLLRKDQPDKFLSQAESFFVCRNIARYNGYIGMEIWFHEIVQYLSNWVE